MIKISIDAGNYKTGTVTSGIERIIDNYLLHSRHIEDVENIVYTFHKKTPNSLPRFGYSSVFLPLKIAIDRPDVFLGFSTYIPPLFNNSKLKKILFVHDLGFISYPNKYQNSHTMLTMLTKSLPRADLIIVPSDYTGRELKRNFSHIHSTVIKRIYWGIDHLTSSHEPRPVPFPYYLYVGVIKPIKHIELLFQTFHSYQEKTNNPNCKLIVIGSREKDYYRELLQLHEYKKIKDLVILIDHVSDPELTSYYQHAQALLNFSFEEGFAFPPLEALSLGTPAVVTELMLYREFYPYTKGLFTGASKEELSNQMIKVGKYEKKSKTLLTPGHPFLWGRFTKELTTVFGSRTNSRNF